MDSLPRKRQIWRFQKIHELEICKTNTRQHEVNLYVPLPDNEFHKSILFHIGAKAWNNLQNNIKECQDILTLKKKLLKCHVKSFRTIS